MKIVTWNINGIRTAPQPLKVLLDKFQAEIICLQETKVTRDMMDTSITSVEGYSAYFSYSRKRSGYSGVVTYCKDDVRPVAAEEGISGYWASQDASKQLDRVGNYGSLSEVPQKELLELDAEGRAVITEHRIATGSGVEQTFCVINVYCPRADKERDDRKAYKLKFCQLMQVRAEALIAAGRHVIIVGDLNTSHRPIDTCDSSGPEYATNPCRIWFDEFIFDFRSPEETSSNRPFVDSFRHFNPDTKEAFTCWSTATGARQTNYGTRIDYILADRTFAKDYLKSCDILPEVHGSDHCPVIADFDCVVIAADKCPSLCAKWMPEFTGRQRKMQDFFSRSVVQPEVICASRSDQVDCEIVEVKPDSKKLRLLEPEVNPPVTKKLKTNASGPTKSGVQMSLKSFFQKSDSVTANLSTSSQLTSGVKTASATPGFRSPEVTESLSGSLHVEFHSTKNIHEEDELVSATSGPPNLSQTSSASESSLKNSDSSSQWKKLLRGPPPAPLCTGHKEPAVLKLVKRSGPNRGRQFYMCAKPEGYKGDVNARCKFFKWI